MSDKTNNAPAPGGRISDEELKALRLRVEEKLERDTAARQLEEANEKIRTGKFVQPPTEPPVRQPVQPFSALPPGVNNG